MREKEVRCDLRTLSRLPGRQRRGPEGPLARSPGDGLRGPQGLGPGRDPAPPSAGRQGGQPGPPDPGHQGTADARAHQGAAPPVPARAPGGAVRPEEVEAPGAPSCAATAPGVGQTGPREVRNRTMDCYCFVWLAAAGILLGVLVAATASNRFAAWLEAKGWSLVALVTRNQRGIK